MQTGQNSPFATDVYCQQIQWVAMKLISRKIPLHGTIKRFLPFFLMGLVGISYHPAFAQGQDVPVEELRFEPTDTARDRVVPLTVYAVKSPQAQPVILFSHGLGGSRDNNAYLGKHWASAGYVTIFMQHVGSDVNVWKSVPRGERLAALKAATQGKSLKNRLDDVKFVIDQLERWNQQSDHPLTGIMDLQHIGMSGHSFGAATTLGVAGRKYPRNRSFLESRIDAFLPMSPQGSKHNVSSSEAFGHISKPVLCMTGTKDNSPIDPSVRPESRLEVFAAFPKGDKYQLVLKDAQHFAFGDGRNKQRRRNPKHHSAIQMISLHFWDAYLKERAESKTWLQSKRVLTESGLDKNEDVWQWK